jgi:hypothetical protein
VAAEEEYIAVTNMDSLRMLENIGRLQPEKSGELTTSERKLRANRENAKRSTGPRTLRGKGYSAANAVKYGLFAMSSLVFAYLGENPRDYEELVKDLRECYEPVGKLEDLLVDRIANCWWRNQRIWRYENCVDFNARYADRNRLEDLEKELEKLDAEDRSVILDLENAIEQIKSTGHTPQDVKQKFTAVRPGFDALWSTLESAAETLLELWESTRTNLRLPFDRTTTRDLMVLLGAIDFVRHFPETRVVDQMGIALGNYVLPDREHLDKILRAEAATDRSMAKAMEQLERLQRQRKEKESDSVSDR